VMARQDRRCLRRHPPPYQLFTRTGRALPGENSAGAGCGWLTSALEAAASTCLLTSRANSRDATPQNHQARGNPPALIPPSAGGATCSRLRLRACLQSHLRGGGLRPQRDSGLNPAATTSRAKRSARVPPLAELALVFKARESSRFAFFQSEQLGTGPADHRAAERGSFEGDELNDYIEALGLETVR